LGIGAADELRLPPFCLNPQLSFDISSQAEIFPCVTPWATLGVIGLTQNEIAEYFAISAP
jgi:hypothetical protein